MKKVFCLLICLLVANCSSFATTNNMNNSCAFIVKNTDSSFNFKDRSAAASVSNLAILLCGSGEIYSDDKLVKEYCNGDAGNVLYVHPKGYGNTCGGITGSITLHINDADGNSHNCVSKEDYTAYKTIDTKHANINIYQLEYPTNFKPGCISQKT